MFRAGIGSTNSISSCRNSGHQPDWFICCQAVGGITIEQEGVQQHWAGMRSGSKLLKGHFYSYWLHASSHEATTLQLPLQTILNSLFFEDILSDCLWGQQVSFEPPSDCYWRYPVLPVFQKPPKSTDSQTRGVRNPHEEGEASFPTFSPRQSCSHFRL